MSKYTIFSLVVFGSVLGCGGLFAQDHPSPPTPAVETEAAKVTTQEGITHDQADAILNELRVIRQLLEKQRSAALRPSGPPIKVKMIVGNDWNSIGQDDAPVTLVEFADYQCPFCRRFHTETFGELKKNYIDTGKIRFVSRDLPLEFHPNAMRAAEAARCAGDQGKYWEMRNKLITNATDLGHDDIVRYAQSLSLDVAGFQSCLDGEKHKAEIQKDQAVAFSLQIGGTPTFILAKTDKQVIEGERLTGAQPYSAFESVIRRLVATWSPQPENVAQK